MLSPEQLIEAAAALCFIDCRLDTHWTRPEIPFPNARELFPCELLHYYTHTMDDNSAISSGAGDDAQAVAAGQDAPGDIVGAPSQASGRLPLSFKVETD